MHWRVFLQDMLMKLAKAVATAAATLVLKAKNVAQKTEDSAQQNRVIAAATQCALSTSQLVACTRVREKKKRTYTLADSQTTCLMLLFYSLGLCRHFTQSQMSLWLQPHRKNSFGQNQ